MRLPAKTVFSAAAAAAAVALFSGHAAAQTPALDGFFQIVAQGLVASIHAVLLPRTGKVMMLERIDGGQAGTVHAMEFDTTTFAVRPVAFASDVFCSAGFVSPDPLARVFNVGGWIGPALEAVRVFVPCGTPGLFGQCQWAEDATLAALKVPRWYPTALPLANGRVAVIGGTTGIVGVFPPAFNQPNMEFVPPAAGEQVITLQLLVDTDTYNMYPHAHLLPNNLVFLMAGDRSQLLNPNTFAPVAELPVIPDGKRTYPFTGGSVLLTLSPRNNYLAEVLVCGGGTGTVITAPALASCGRISPLDPAAQWQMEAMPYARVMPDLTLLPDGTVLILNGAQTGWAGFANAEYPVQTAVLYDPYLPVGARMRPLATSTIARLYHSEALLMDDGRVLVFGSTPNANANVDPATVPYPNELRIEVYTPPYLANGGYRPVLMGGVPLGGVAYMQAMTLNVALPSGAPQQAQIVLMTNGFVTHSTHMGQRRVELSAVWQRVGGAGAAAAARQTQQTPLYNVQVTGPPNAAIVPPGWYQLFVVDGRMPSVAQWVQVGGDPYGVGRWLQNLA
ncbi:glyoxal oxidase N-terminus-domain-containing protein [Entophlyctis helioformis]|nr:glyoxal oxidase N-terminus-domain-containing protein [Entophlyctis helioformis]